MPNATAPLDSRTPRKLKDPDQTTAICAGSECVNYSRYCIGSVMEAVHELEAERDQQRDEKQQIGKKSGGSRAAGVDIGVEAVCHIEHTTCRQQEKDYGGARVHCTIELGTHGDRAASRSYMQRGVGHFPSPLMSAGRLIMAA